jgi:hypothetical protein
MDLDDCVFTLSFHTGIVSRNRACKVSECSGILDLSFKGIRQLDAAVFANLSGVTEM